MNLEISYDQSEARLIDTSCEQALVAIRHAWDEGRTPNIVLTGGRTGAKIAKALDLQIARSISNRTGEKAKVNIWLSDERFVEEGDIERTGRTLLGEFSNSTSHINFERVLGPAEATLEQAASEYGVRLNATLASEANTGRFDAVFLSMGEDGHIASCFPGDLATLTSKGLTAAISNSPKPPAERISLTITALGKTTLVLVFALGAAKEAALAETLARVTAMPLELLRQNSPVGQIIIFTDQNQIGRVAHGK